MIIKNKKEEYLVLAFLVMTNKKEFKILDIRDLKGYKIEDGSKS